LIKYDEDFTTGGEHLLHPHNGAVRSSKSVVPTYDTARG